MLCAHDAATVAELVDAASRVLAPLNANHDAVARGDLRAALQKLTGEAFPTPDVRGSIADNSLVREMRLLAAMVGTDSPEGRAEMRGIARRAYDEVREMTDALVSLRAHMEQLADSSHAADLAKADAILARVLPAPLVEAAVA